MPNPDPFKAHAVQKPQKYPRKIKERLITTYLHLLMVGVSGELMWFKWMTVQHISASDFKKKNLIKLLPQNFFPSKKRAILQWEKNSMWKTNTLNWRFYSTAHDDKSFKVQSKFAWNAHNDTSVKNHYCKTLSGVSGFS